MMKVSTFNNILELIRVVLAVILLLVLFRIAFRFEKESAQLQTQPKEPTKVQTKGLQR